MAIEDGFELTEAIKGCANDIPNAVKAFNQRRSVVKSRMQLTLFKVPEKENAGTHL